MRPACVICTEIFVVNSHISACACGHIFHEECLFRWFSTSQKSCPQCRAKLKDSDVIKRLFLTESDSLPSTQSLTDFNDEHVKQKYEDLLNRYEQLKSDLRDKTESLNQKSKIIEQRDAKIKELDDFKSSHKKKLNENAVLVDYLKKELEGHAKTKELYESREKKIFELESKLKEYKAIDLIYREHEEEFAAEMRKFVTSTSNVSHLQTIIRQLVSSNVLLKEHLSKNSEEKKLMRKKLAQIERMQAEKDKFLAKKESEMSEMSKKIAMLENLKSDVPEEDAISSSQPVKASSTPILPRSFCTDDSDIQYLDDIGRFENSYLRKKDLNSPVTPMLAQKRKNPFLKMSDDESDEVTEIPAYQPESKKMSLSQVIGHNDDCSEDIVLVKPVEKVTKPNRLFKTASFHSGLKTSRNANDSIEIKPLTKNTSSYVCDGLGGRQKMFKSDNLKSYFVTSNSKGQKLSKFKVT